MAMLGVRKFNAFLQPCCFLLQRSFSLKFILGQKNVGSEKMFGPKNFRSKILCEWKTCLVRKKCWVKKNSGFGKIFWVHKKVWVEKKIWVWKNFGSEKIVGFEKILGPKKMLVKKILIPKKILGLKKKVGSKILWFNFGKHHLCVTNIFLVGSVIVDFGGVLLLFLFFLWHGSFWPLTP